MYIVYAYREYIENHKGEILNPETISVRNRHG